MKRSNLAVAALVALAACGSSAGSGRVVLGTPSSTSEVAPSPSTSPAALALERWHEQAVGSCSFRYVRSCFCQSLVGVVTVADGRVTAWTSATDQQSVGAEQPPMNQLSTIDALLATAARAETEATGPVQIVFDPVSGVPTDASIDWLKDAMDDECGWHMSDFRRLGEAPTVSSDRPMFCDLAVRASEGHVAFGSPGETDALVSYNDLTAVQRDVLRSVLEDADERTKRGEGWDNRFLVSFVNDVCGLHLTPITMTP